MDQSCLTFHQRMNKIYPNSVPEFRILQLQDKTQHLQIRYVNTAVKYVGQWQNVPIVNENEQ
jgi:hypothetical protein